MTRCLSLGVFRCCQHSASSANFAVMNSIIAMFIITIIFLCFMCCCMRACKTVCLFLSVVCH